MIEVLKQVRAKAHIAFVGGADISKIRNQSIMDNMDLFDFWFGENGSEAYKNGEVLRIMDISKEIGEENVQEWIKFILCYISRLELPFMRGSYIDYRHGMINVNPPGATLTKEQRNEFEEFDNKLKIRETMIEILKARFPDIGLEYAIGGQIGFDCFPIGWNKTFCLRYLEDYTTIHFFGDKCHEGGNDHALFKHERTIGHEVTGPQDTIKLLKEIALGEA